LNTILIGLGDIAPLHLAVLEKLNCNVKGVIARNYDKASVKAKRLGINKIYKSLEEISENNYDFFTVLASPENNGAVLKQILSFKKPVLIEKPVTFSSKELEAIIDLNKKFNSLVMVATNRRFYSIFHKGLKYLKKKDKKLYSVVIEAPERFSDINLPKFSDVVRQNWMFCNSIHCIDLIRFFGGNIVKIETNSNPEKCQYGAIGRCENDIDFTYISNWRSPGSWSVTLYADDVRITYNPLEKGVIFEKSKKTEIVPAKEDLEFKPGFYFQLKHFLDHVVSNNKFVWPASDLSDHKSTLLLIENIYKVR